MKYQNSTQRHLHDYIDQVLIIAYKESTQQLEQFMIKEGFDCQVLRQESKPEYQEYSRSYLCMMNHCRAWQIAAQKTQPTIVVEADFAPVVDFGKLPISFDINNPDVGIAWLYTCAPQVYYVSPEGYAQGFSTSAVAYIITPKAASYLIELAQEVTNTTRPKQYTTWDSEIDNFLRQRQLKNYIPWRNYGEHGGLPNPEHRQNNLGNLHRADILYAKLAFSPIYAEKTGTFSLLLNRLKARSKGIARLVTGRFLRVAVAQGSSTPWRLISFAVLRQFYSYPKVLG